MLKQMHRSGWQVKPRTQRPSCRDRKFSYRGTRAQGSHPAFRRPASAGLLNPCPRGKADPFSVTQVQNDHRHMREMAVGHTSRVHPKMAISARAPGRRAAGPLPPRGAVTQMSPRPRLGPSPERRARHVTTWK